MSYKTLLTLLVLGTWLTAVGTIGMAYYQRQANSGFFVALPTDPAPQSKPRSF